MKIYKRPNSKFYWFKFTFRGKLIQQSTKCSNKKDAETFASAFRTQLVLGKIGIEPKQEKEIPTFDLAVKDFLEWSQVGNVTRKVTHARYVFACKHLQRIFGDVKVDKIHVENIEKYIFVRSREKSRKTGKFVTRETINHELKCLKSIFNRLCEKEILLSNPTKAIKLLPKNDLKFHVVSKEEECRYLLACPGTLQAVATLMLELGMRCREIYHLKKADVFIEKGYLKIADGKTKSAKRTLYLTEKAKSVLQSRINKFKGEYLFPKGDKDGKEPIVTLFPLHKRVVEKLGFQFRLYDLRHTFATRAVENGMNLVVLASLLGHTDLKMVMRYAHPSESHKKEAMKILEQKLSKAI